MCGRFVLRQPSHPWLHDLPPELERPRYNIAPSQWIAAVGNDRAGDRRVRPALWGFRPPWLDERRKAPINARAETVATAPMFRRAFARGRCLIPADGWYEWQAQDGGPKQPQFFHRRAEGLFWFAGVATRDGEGRTTAAILTVDADETARAVHPRMPLLFPDDETAAAWIDADTGAATLRDLLRPPEIGALEYVPVSRRVNRPENDDARCIAAADEGGSGEGQRNAPTSGARGG